MEPTVKEQLAVILAPCASRTIGLFSGCRDSEDDMQSSEGHHGQYAPQFLFAVGTRLVFTSQKLFLQLVERSIYKEARALPDIDPGRDHLCLLSQHSLIQDKTTQGRKREVVRCAEIQVYAT